MGLPVIKPEHLEAMQDALLTWYAVARRDLPWRHTRDPYRIWVSEVMLQQTQVPTAVAYYERFLDAFPTLEALAEAEPDAVLAVWQGLGYYARARNLHAAAQQVVDRHGGHVPSNMAELRALPGVGPYIAAAVLSIAFGEDVAAVDTNTARVLCRLIDYAGDLGRAEGQRLVSACADDLLARGRAGDHNAAMMELGATICQARAPGCPSCPLEAWCLARARGTADQRPTRPARKPVPTRVMAAAWCLESETEVPPRLLLVRRRPEGLLGGLWEFPTVEVAAGEAPEEVLNRALSTDLGVRAMGGEPLATVRHAYSHFRVIAHVYHCRACGVPRAAGPWDEARYVSPAERGGIGVTGVTARVLDRLASRREKRPEA